MRRESPQPSGATPPSEPINTSDNESGGEKPVREKLRDTRIANQAMEDDTTSTGSSAGRLPRKRSLEGIQGDENNDEEPGKPGKHARKRSRSNTLEDKMDSVEDDTPQTVANGSRDPRSPTPPELSSGRADEAQPAGLASPKNKRTRDQVSKDEESAVTGLATQSPQKDNKLPGDDRQTKRHRDSGSPEPPTAPGTTKVGLRMLFDTCITQY
jgi:Ran-binding protein 3